MSNFNPEGDNQNYYHNLAKIIGGSSSPEQLKAIHAMKKPKPLCETDPEEDAKIASECWALSVTRQICPTTN